MHVLIVEDDRLIAGNLYEFLEACGHRCDYADSLQAARARLAADSFDALVLDRNLPDGDGASLADSLRRAGNSVPILMLTARDTLDDKLAGFAAGADDYLAKPFALKEVAARLLALGRRTSVAGGSVPVELGGVRYDPYRQELSCRGELLALPPKASRLLGLLLAQPERLFSRRELEVAVWGQEQASSDNLRSLLHTLRKALDGRTAIEIRTVHGLGYRLVAG